MRWFIVLSVLFIAAAQVGVAADAKKQKWWQQNFKENAEGTPRAMAARAETTRRDDADKWFRCAAVRDAIFTHRELYVSNDDQHICFSDEECTTGDLGGMCTSAAHKATFIAYKLYLKSPEYKFLAKEWKADSCFGPVGLCLPIDKAFCKKPSENEAGKCEGKWGTRHSVEPIFMVKEQ